MPGEDSITEKVMCFVLAFVEMYKMSKMLQKQLDSSHVKRYKCYFNAVFYVSDNIRILQLRWPMSELTVYINISRLLFCLVDSRMSHILLNRFQHLVEI